MLDGVGTMFVGLTAVFDQGLEREAHIARRREDARATVARWDVTVTLPDEMAAIIPVAEQSGREQIRIELGHMKKLLEGTS